MRNAYGWIALVCLTLIAGKYICLNTIARVDEPEKERAAQQRVVEIVVRAYCPCKKCCGRNADGRTADGRKIRKSDYTIAISPDLEEMGFELGGTIDVPGYGNATIRDRTHRRRHRQIEVLMTVWKDGKSPHRRAQLWGHKRLEVRLPVGTKAGDS